MSDTPTDPPDVQAARTEINQPPPIDVAWLRTVPIERLPAESRRLVMLADTLAHLDTLTARLAVVEGERDADVMTALMRQSEAFDVTLAAVKADLAALRIEHARNADLLTAARRERGEARQHIPAAQSCHRLADYMSTHRDLLEYDGCDMAGDGAIRVLGRLAEERDELRASLDNERGEGSGPSDGWAFDGKPAFAWAKRYGHRLVDITRDPRHGWRVVWWIVTPDGRVDGDSHEHRGTGPLVRDLMRAADAALAGSGS